MNFDNSDKLRSKAHALIPGGCHTYAKGDDQYPVHSPGFISKGEGCRVWDLDGNEFIEYGMGLRAVTLGHAYPSVVDAAYRQMLLGNNYTRPSAIEVECAEMMVELIDAADMVKFAKNGSDATTAAARLSRAYTGRDLIAVCQDHPFFSVDDWFIGSTPMAAGIPEAIRNLTVKFKYNDISSVVSLFDEYPGQIACLFLEAATSVEPEEGFLNEVRKLCTKHGTVLILDEMITGFRWHLKGAQNYYGVKPDLSTFGKAMGNGFSIAALAGKREIMDLGGITHDKERVFLLSTTQGAENHALAATLATIKVYREHNVIEHLWTFGDVLRQRVNEIIASLKLEDYFQLLGQPCNLVYATKDQEKNPSQEFRALFLQETIRNGLLMPSLVISYSHREKDIEQTVQGIGEALHIYRKALDEGVEKYLIGRPLKPVFRKYN
ncbi:glutamate-1-semialdehyde 2,1-aminomutase [Geobacter sp. AOG2]|nr:glutamate-1-semialdehyde 2,1-aminomutase [Geobacter sp. AOG2]GFE60819.1 glutamate-1-semialdehyde 2,1-aminomutase [Geobacter sp. AOG2]